MENSTMQRLVKVVAVVLVLSAGSIQAPGQEAGGSTGPRFSNWLGAPRQPWM
jgi:hypothetical protein